MGRAMGLLVGAMLVVTLSACGVGTPQDTSAEATQTGADVRERLAAGLAAVGSDAEMVRDRRTTLTPVDAAWLQGWQIFDIQLNTEYRSSRFYAALSDDGTAVDLDDSPESFAEMTRSAHVSVNDASLAVDVGNLYLDVTRGFRRYSYRIDSVSAIEWPELNPAEQQQVAEFETKYDAIVQPSVAEPSGTGWTVTAWTIYDRSLVRHRLEIAADGAVQDTQEVVATDLLLPQTF